MCAAVALALHDKWLLEQFLRPGADAILLIKKCI